MTVITGIEIDEIQKNTTSLAIINNEPIDNILHCVTMISNPCLYARRYQLARQFIKRIENTDNIKLYVVEIAYKKDNKYTFYVTDKTNPQHLQLQVDTAPLWHKENAINIGIQKLLPSNWKAVAWIDADIEFENPHWAMDTLKLLNGHADVLQLFTLALDMNKRDDPMTIFQGFGYQYYLGKKHGGKGLLFWHPGYAWACTRRSYEKMGGLFEYSILGSGDHNMALSLISRGQSSINCNASDGYKKQVQLYQDRVTNLRLGYVPTTIRHSFHGSKRNRKYVERWQILVNNKYDPLRHITKNKDGVLIPTKECPQQMLDDILEYFTQRNEDEGFLED